MIRRLLCPLLSVLWLLVLQAQDQSESPTAPDYVGLARQAVEDELREAGMPIGQFRIEVDRDSGLPPEPSSFRLDRIVAPMVVLKTYRGDQLSRTDLVGFEGLEPQIWESWTGATDAIDTEFGTGRLLLGSEWDRLIVELDPLLATLYDVSRGPGRLAPFFSSQLVCYVFDSGVRMIPSIDHERCATVLLDSAALVSWHYLVGGTRGSIPWPPDFDQYRSSNNDEERLLAAQRANEQLLEELRVTGIFESEYSIHAQDYLRRLITIKGVRLTAFGQFLPVPTEIPYLMMRVWVRGQDMFLFLIPEDGQFRVVSVLFAGG